jgi:DNA integrity scanning protein DisA with diadenylate cyclase activity
MPNDQDVSDAIIESAITIAKRVKAEALLVYADATGNLDLLAELKKGSPRLLMLARDDEGRERAAALTDTVVSVPNFNLTRMDQIKVAVLMAFSQRLLAPGDTFVFLTGIMGQPLDTIVTMSVGQEQEIFQSVKQPKLTEHIRRVVFERVITIALELANEGREGKPVGAIFVIGNHREVTKFSQQNIINPFKGYTEKERNILDDAMRETIKEFCTLDGAFVLKGNGVIVSAGTHLRPGVAGEPLPQGLGARHAAAAAITASTKSMAITISESTGTVRVWRLGQLITEIEKAPRPTGTHVSRSSDPVGGA